MEHIIIERLIENSSYDIRMDYIDYIFTPVLEWMSGGYVENLHYIKMCHDKKYFLNRFIYYPFLTFNEYIKLRFLGLQF